MLLHLIILTNKLIVAFNYYFKNALYFSHFEKNIQASTFKFNFYPRAFVKKLVFSKILFYVVHFCDKHSEILLGQNFPQAHFIKLVMKCLTFPYFFNGNFKGLEIFYVLRITFKQTVKSVLFAHKLVGLRNSGAFV